MKLFALLILLLFATPLPVMADQAAQLLEEQPAVQPPPSESPPARVDLAPTNMLQGGAEQDAMLQNPQPSPTYWQPVNQTPLMYQRPELAQPMYQAPIPLYAQQHQPLFGGATLDSRGTPTLPVWKTEADEIIGKFHIDFFGITIKQLNGPPSNRCFFTKVKKWRGDRHQPCSIFLVKVLDGSGGYYFHCMESRYGPRGWIYPIAKRGPQDKVTPWAIFFDQR